MRNPVVVADDFNGDTRPDLAVFDAGVYYAAGLGGVGNPPQLFLSTPDGPLQPSDALADAVRREHELRPNPDYSGPADLHVKSAASGDIDGDADVDLWVESTGGANVASHFMVNNGDGTFTIDDGRAPDELLHNPPPEFWRHVGNDLVDLDNDGDLDLVLGQIRDLDPTHINQFSIVLANDGAGHYPARIELPHPAFGDGHTAVEALTHFDVNGDGLHDLLLPHTRNDDGPPNVMPWTGRYIQVLINRGAPFGVLRRQRPMSFSDETPTWIRDQREGAPSVVEGRWRLLPGCGISRVLKREERPPMKKPYRIVSGASTPDRRELADWLAKDGQLLIPLVELLEKGERAIDEVIDVMGRATIEAVLRMSAEQVAGPKEQGRRDADRELYWHGVQAGRVALKERQLRVDKPRLRKKRPRADEPGEVEIPAYATLQADQPLADRMLEVVLQGVSTRKYETVLPALADQVGVSKSEVSRETIEAGTRVLKELAERALGELDVLVVYLDGIVFGDYHVLAAVGVDADGRKHVLGLCGGASENTEVTAGLLEDLVARGLRADRRRLFVIDGAKALRQAIGRVFGSSNLVQRCRNHKVRNVLSHLPKEQHDQARSTLRAAWKLDADEGIRKLEQYASWLEREWPSAAASLREGLSEMFTVNRLGLPKPLRRCLTTTNIIDSSHAGIRQHTNRVSRWQSEAMAVRWAAVTFRETEKHYRRITGYEHMWMLKAHLDDEDGALAQLQKVG